MKTIFRCIFAFVLLHQWCVLSATPLGTAFTYQGHLNDNGQPANGSFDISFQLHADPLRIVPVGNPVIHTNVHVANGLFSVELDFQTERATKFGSPFDGDAHWLEIQVRPFKTASFVTLSPRQRLTPTPNAIYAANAGSAQHATEALQATSATTAANATHAASADQATSAANAAHANTAGQAAAAQTAPWSGLTGVPAGIKDGVDNDTTYTAGMGLLLSPDREFKVDFGDESDTVARGNHNHTGKTWSAPVSQSAMLTLDNTSGNSPYGLKATAHGASGASFGVLGESTSSDGVGVLGIHSATTGSGSGVLGRSDSASAGAVGVHGIVTSDSLPAFSAGVWGRNNSASYGNGVLGEHAGAGFGVQGKSAEGRGVYGYAWKGGETNYGVYGLSDSAKGFGVFAENSHGTALKASGTGIIESTAESVIWVPGSSIALHAWTVATGTLHKIEERGSARFVVPENFGSPNGVLQYAHCGITMPAVLYGQPTAIKEITIYYKVSQGCEITVRELSRFGANDNSIIPMIDTQPVLTSTTRTGYTFSESALKNRVLSNVSGGIYVDLLFKTTVAYSGMVVYGIRITLGHE
jgi:hypothetical protein